MSNKFDSNKLNNLVEETSDDSTKKSDDIK